MARHRRGLFALVFSPVKASHLRASAPGALFAVSAAQ
jgi:hypothetical protein